MVKNRHQLVTDRPNSVILFVLLAINGLAVDVSADHMDHDINWSQIPQILLQPNAGMAANGGHSPPMSSQVSNVFGLDAIRGFFSRNHQWITPLLAATPLKLATFMTVRALRQQEAEDIQNNLDNVDNVDNVIPLDPVNGQEDQSGGEQGLCRRCRDLDLWLMIAWYLRLADDDCDDDNCNDISDISDNEAKKKKSFMMFFGRGNIQVKNHKEEWVTASESPLRTTIGRSLTQCLSIVITAETMTAITTTRRVWLIRYIVVELDSLDSLIGEYFVCFSF